MKYAIDETELARLEALACAAGDADYSAHDDADDSTKYAAAACNDVPALVAEVRRMREKVEAWEWFDEVRIYKPWNEHPNWEACGNSSKRGKIFDRAVDEYKLIYKAAREAVHADRE